MLFRSLFGTASWATSASNAIINSTLTSNQTVGGNPAGTVYTAGTSIETILRKILIAYIPPTINTPQLLSGSTTILSSTSYREVGTSITYNTASFTATADNPNGRFAYSASFTASGGTSGDFNYYFGNNVLSSTNNLGLGSNRTSVRTSDGTITFSLVAKNPETFDIITATPLQAIYVYPFFYGMSTTDYSTTGNLSAGIITAGSITVGVITTGAITSTTINAGTNTITAGGITVGSITTGNIKSGTINAGTNQITSAWVKNHYFQHIITIKIVNRSLSNQ